MRALAKQKAFRFFTLALGVLLLAWWPTVAHLWDLVWTIDAYSHGIWVPFVSAWLIYRKRVVLSALEMKPYWPALVALVVLSGAWLLGEAAQARIVQHIALVGAVNALALGVLGTNAFRVIRFPMLFLFLMIPLGEQLVAPLQIMTAKAVIWLLDITGFDFTADGVLIELSGGLYQVARACAGVKFLFTSMVMSILLCHLVLQSWKRRILLLVAGAVVPVAANIVRVYTTILIAEMSGQEFAKGVDHILYGWGFLSIILIILVAVAYRYADKPLADESSSATDHAPTSALGSGPYVRAAGVVVFPAITGLWAAFLISPTEAGVLRCVDPRFEAGECTGCETRLLGMSLGNEGRPVSSVDRNSVWRYRIHGAVIEGATGLYAPDRLGRRVRQMGFSYLGTDWAELEGEGAQGRRVEGATFAETIIWQGENRKLVWRAFVVDGHFFTSELAMKTELAKRRIQGRPAIAQTFAVATDLQSDGEAARDVLHKFLTDIPPTALLWQLAPQRDLALCVA